ncbi:MAG: manganese ABC transporter permease [Dictyoglomus sp. NZ13-RE01]|nr:MAG: manganese ABC transporter permease [Dictyoglomus sp. NZ13-RE01]
MNFLAYGFMQRAIISGLLLSVVTSILGAYLVFRGLTFMGSGISHSAFGGIALGILLGINPLISAIIFSLFVVWLIPFINRKVPLKGDVPIGIFYTSSMALGSIFLALHKGYTVDLFSYLFGNILGVGYDDIIITLFFLFLVLLFFFKNYWRIVYIIFDPISAEVSGINTFVLEEIVLSLSAIAIVLASKLIGIILISALLVIPPSIAIPRSKSFKEAVFLSSIISLIGIWGGLISSFYLNLPSGSTIILILTLIFFISVYRRKK